MAGRAIVSDLAAMAHSQGEDAIEAMVREHARLVYRIAYAVLRNHHDAEDATQETFMRVLRHGRKLKHVFDRKAWLARIGWRVAIERREKRPEVSLHVIEHAANQPCAPQERADDLLIAGQRAELLDRLIAGLPGQLRDVVALSSLQDLAHGEIATILEISETSVRSRLFRARQILKEKLAVLEKRHGT
jgi:RNA polymerase sigma-70 factor (ECF subfamily)